jgi:hypothetical protein
MAKKPSSPTLRSKGRQIVGFSLPPDLAAEVKAEAGRRKVALRTLFIELWSLYSLASDVSFEAAGRNISSKDLLLESWNFYKNNSKKRL